MLRVLGNSTKWIFTLGDYTEPNKLDFIIHTGYNAWWKVNKCTEMDENKVESGKIPKDKNKLNKSKRFGDQKHLVVRLVEHQIQIK